MKPEDLKLYHTYNDVRYNKKYIYIGNDNSPSTNLNYCFLIKEKDRESFFEKCWLKDLSFLNILNIQYSEQEKTYLIKDYKTWWPSLYEINFLEPILKDKLKNIINR